MPNDYWETPKNLFENLKEYFGITWDACATDENALLKYHWNEEDNLFEQIWDEREVYFMNPPYGRDLKDKPGIGSFLRKASEVPMFANIIVLIPANIGTIYFQKYCLDPKFVKAIYFIEGRLTYTLNNIPQGKPRFDSCIIHFERDSLREHIEFYKSNNDFSEIKRI